MDDSGPSTDVGEQKPPGKNTSNASFGLGEESIKKEDTQSATHDDSKAHDDTRDDWSIDQIEQESDTQSVDRESIVSEIEGRQSQLISQRRIMFLADTWCSTKDGISCINYSLLAYMARFKGIELYCAILEPETRVSHHDKKEAYRMGVILVYPMLPKVDKSMKNMVSILSKDPGALYSQFFESVKNVTHLVGHDPVTSRGIIAIRDKFYPDAVILQMFHCIPKNLEWMQEIDALPYTLPTDEEYINIAESADVVYCINRTTKLYYAALFRNKANKRIDLRVFWPRCHEDIFLLPKEKRNWRERGGELNLAVLDDGFGANIWSGTEMAGSATEKINKLQQTTQTLPKTNLTILGTQPGTTHVPEILTSVKRYLKTKKVSIHYREFRKPEKFFKYLQNVDLIISPIRGEPLGIIGLLPLCVGVPFLLSDISAMHDIVEKVSKEPDMFAAPVTKNNRYVLQDASVWRDRILEVIDNPKEAMDRAEASRIKLNRDEISKMCYDNFLSYCLGGVKIRFIAKLVYLFYMTDPCDELRVRRQLNQFVFDAMKLVWRLEHHPLVTQKDLHSPIKELSVPWKNLRDRILMKVEDHDRKIIEVDPDSYGFVVYCPTTDALWDLWCLCDIINARMLDTMFPVDSPIFTYFRMKKVDFVCEIRGPDFLRYKEEIMTHTYSRPRGTKKKHMKP